MFKFISLKSILLSSIINRQFMMEIQLILLKYHSYKLMSSDTAMKGKASLSSIEWDLCKKWWLNEILDAINNTFRGEPFWECCGCPVLVSWHPNPPTTFRLSGLDLVRVLPPKPTFFGIIYYKRSALRRRESSNPNKSLLGLYNHKKSLTVGTQNVGLTSSSR